MKNKMMRIASVLLVAALITTCAISGTFAKYVTKVSGEDSARVAKWGIILGVTSGQIFADKYKTHDDTYEGEYSVVAYNSTEEVAGDKLVAPGTSSADLDASIKATVFGTPEVATRYILKIEGLKDVILPAGTYTDYTELKLGDDGKYAYGTFVNEKDYTPVKWNFKVSNSNGVSYDLVSVAATLGKEFKGFSFTDAQSIVETENYMNALLPMLEGMVAGASNAQCEVKDGVITISMDFDPNVEMDYTFELTWVWDFDDEGKGTYDKQDTYLGNVAAEALLDTNVAELDDAEAKVSTDIAATLTATAVQID